MGEQQTDFPHGKRFQGLCSHEKGGALIGLCNDPEGPEPGTEQGPVRADQTAGDLFWSGGALQDSGHASLLPVRHVLAQRAAPGGEGQTIASLF